MATMNTATFDGVTGLTPATMRIRANHGLTAIEVRIDAPTEQCEVVLSPSAALDTILRLIGALHRLNRVVS
jgi:hypothetical protein